jgi:hypothetical protein
MCARARAAPSFERGRAYVRACAWMARRGAAARTRDAQLTERALDDSRRAHDCPRGTVAAWVAVSVRRGTVAAWVAVSVNTRDRRRHRLSSRTAVGSVLVRIRRMSLIRRRARTTRKLLSERVLSELPSELCFSFSESGMISNADGKSESRSSTNLYSVAQQPVDVVLQMGSLDKRVSSFGEEQPHSEHASCTQ